MPPLGHQERPNLHPYAVSTLAAEAQSNIYSTGNSLSPSQQPAMSSRPGPWRPPAPVRQSPYSRPPASNVHHVSGKSSTYMRPPYQNQAPAQKPPIHHSVPRSVPQSLPQMRAPAVSSRIANTNAAIAAIQAVAPPVVQPVPIHRPLMALVGLPQLTGGDLKGTVRFDHEKGVKVIDEITAQKSAADFSIYLDETRKKRHSLWSSYWLNRLDLNRKVLLAENQCFKEAREDASELDDSEEEEAPRKSRPIVVPYFYHNTGSFDVELPPKVIIPDPEVVLMRTQPNQLAQEHSQLVHHVQRPFFPPQTGPVSAGAGPGLPYSSLSHGNSNYGPNISDQVRSAQGAGPGYDPRGFSSARQRAAQQVIKGTKF